MSEIGENARRLIDQLLKSKDKMGTAEIKGTLLDCADGSIRLFVHTEKDRRTGDDSIMGEVILEGKEKNHIVDHQNFGWYPTARESVKEILSKVRFLLQKQHTDKDRMKELGFEFVWWGLYRFKEITVSVNVYGCTIQNRDDCFIRETVDPARTFRMYAEYSVDSISRIPKELLDRLVKSPAQELLQRRPLFSSTGNPQFYL